MVTSFMKLLSPEGKLTPTSCPACIGNVPGVAFIAWVGLTQQVDCQLPKGRMRYTSVLPSVSFLHGNWPQPILDKHVLDGIWQDLVNMKREPFLTTQNSKVGWRQKMKKINIGFFFLGLHLQDMEVPRPEAESEVQQLAYVTLNCIWGHYQGEDLQWIQVIETQTS